MQLPERVIVMGIKLLWRVYLGGIEREEGKAGCSPSLDAFILAQDSRRLFYVSATFNRRILGRARVLGYNQ